MAYIIDGHNLIPKIRGLSLQALDDEQQLIERLQEFCRRQRKQVEVYFDGAPPGQQGSRKYGAVRAIFVRQGITADEVIRQRLDKMDRSAANWIVVSSDRAVQSAARTARAQVMSSETFANQLEQGLSRAPQASKPDGPVPPGEVEEWLQIFKEAEQKKKKP